MPRQQPTEMDDPFFAGQIADEMDFEEGEDAESIADRNTKRRLHARRAIEDYREKRRLHKELDDWDYEFDENL